MRWGQKLTAEWRAANPPPDDGTCSGDRCSLQNSSHYQMLQLLSRLCSLLRSPVCEVWGQHIKRSLQCWGAVSMVDGHFSELGTHIHRQANGSLETGSSSVPPCKAVTFTGHSTSFLILGLCRASSPNFSRGSCGIRIDCHASCLPIELL